MCYLIVMSQNAYYFNRLLEACDQWYNIYYMFCGIKLINFISDSSDLVMAIADIMLAEKQVSLVYFVILILIFYFLFFVYCLIFLKWCIHTQLSILW